MTEEAGLLITRLQAQCEHLKSAAYGAGHDRGDGEKTILGYYCIGCGKKVNDA